ncbi:MAG TPA: YdcF family protein [Pseudolabrys sp.]
MFFVLSKTVGFLLLPSNILILLGLAGVALMATRRKRIGVSMAVASLVLLAAVGFLPIGSLLLYPLESRFPEWNANRGAPDGIVVLGGAIAPRLSKDYGEPVISGDAGRIIAMAKLARNYPNARIVYSGGDASLFGNEPRETEFVYPLLDSFGVPRSRVALEARSRNTAENAVYTKELVNPKPGERWLLVTSAQHMPRAIGCFRKAGFVIEAYPVGWQGRRAFEPSLGRVLAKGLARLDAAAYEWIGLISYWLTGKTSELLPSP